MPAAYSIKDNIDSSNGLLLDVSKPIPKPMLNNP